MKKILFNSMVMIVFSKTLTGCFYGSCSDWNCTKPNSRWLTAVTKCQSKNYGIVFQVLGDKLFYKSIPQVQDSEIGQHISHQCNLNDGQYDIHKDKQYGHLFLK